jgi:hypothetical protein
MNCESRPEEVYIVHLFRQTLLHFINLITSILVLSFNSAKQGIIAANWDAILESSINP